MSAKLAPRAVFSQATANKALPLVRAIVQDIVSYEKTQETLALLKILALANRNIEEGRYRPAKDVFADLRKRLNARKAGK